MKESSSRDFESPRWALPFFFGLLLSTIPVIILALQPLRWPEYWWHLQIGEFIATWRRIPDGQLFLFTLPVEETFHYSSWLGDLLLFYSHYYGGAEFSLLLRNLAAGLAVFVFSFPALRWGTRPGALFLVALVLTPLLALLVPLTGAIFAIPLLAIVGVLLGRLSGLQGEKKKVWVLGLLTVVTLAGLVQVHFTMALFAILVATGVGIWRKCPPLLLSPLMVLTLIYGPSALFSTFSDGFSAGAVIIGLGLPLVGLGLLYLPAWSYRPVGFKSKRTLLVTLGILGLLGIAIPLQPGVPTRGAVMKTLHDDLRPLPPMEATLPAGMPLGCVEELRRTGRSLRVYTDEPHHSFVLFHLYNPEGLAPLLFHDHRHLLPAHLEALPELLKTEPIARGIFAAQKVNAVIVSRQTHPALVADLDVDPAWVDLDEHLARPHTCYLHVWR